MPAPVSDQARRSVRRVAEEIAAADALLITAGAGMSVDSGLPDFRSRQGLWRSYPLLGRARMPFELMAQPVWFADRPHMAWAWYEHRRQLYRDAVPHDGHRLLDAWSSCMPGGRFVVTSNVDGQFVAAGFGEFGVLEQHGSIHRWQCTLPCSQQVWDAEGDLAIDLEQLQVTGDLPGCPHCGALARPNVLMFNDTAWVDAVRREQQPRFDRWLEGVRGQRLVILEIGAGTAIPTIRRLGERLAQRSRTTLVRINPQATEADETTHVLRLPALQALTLIQESLPEEMQRRVESPRPVRRFEPPPPGRRLKLRIGPLAHVDLGRGLAGAFDATGIAFADESACLERYGEAQQGWVPLPTVRGLAAPGYTMTARIFRTPEYEAGRTPGVAIIFVQGPDDKAVLTLGLARRESDAPFLWRLLYETACRPLAALEYPRAPWVVRRPDCDLSQHAAVLPALLEIERTLAWSWFRFMAFLDACRGED